MNKDIELLKQVLSIPTKTYQETLMVKFITRWLEQNNIPYHVDTFNNIYATKSTNLTEGEYFPCVICHIDTVHDITNINVTEENRYDIYNNLKPSLVAYDDDKKPTGIGGDDKCGIFACFKLLQELENVKSAFFVSEELGCFGSKNSYKPFFNDVGYCIQFDAPYNHLVSEYSWGVKLFDRESKFFEICDQTLPEGKLYESHPYTDIYQIKLQYDFACINLSIGYYKYHTPYEYVVIDDVYNGINNGINLIKNLGNMKYHFESDRKYFYQDYEI